MAGVSVLAAILFLTIPKSGNSENAVEEKKKESE